MEYIIVQLATAFIGSLGFAIILKIKGKQIVYAGIGGVLSWGVYLWAYAQLEGYFAANFIAALFVAVYAEIMARVNKAPATIFLTAAAINDSTRNFGVDRHRRSAHPNLQYESGMKN